jgi:CHAD domain-containing protein
MGHAGLRLLIAAPTRRVELSMAVIHLPTETHAKHIGLDLWMDRALSGTRKLRPDWDADDIHDLRVALRRSRTMAEALSEVNPDPGWRKVKKASSELFHALGDLRDAQMAGAWVKKLGASRDPLRAQMLRFLAQQEKKHRKAANAALKDFDRKHWRKLAKKLSPKARFFPVESVVFQRLALTRLNGAVALDRQARKTRSSAAWHRLRIGIKHFRYIVENFLPQRYEVWAEDMKRMQDLLGDVHDLDVLRREIRRQTRNLDPAIVAQWLAKIDTERKARLTECLGKTSGANSPWIVWRAGLLWGHALVAASLPRSKTA